jgi:hypothetical protein
LLSLSLLARLWYTILSYWLPGPCPILTFLAGLARVPPWLIGSLISDSSYMAYSSPWWWRQ